MSFGFENNCERCGEKLEDGMVMSMFNMEIICMECKKEEMRRSDYPIVEESENDKEILFNDFITKSFVD